jgi:hypothetical protein
MARNIAIWHRKSTENTYVYTVFNPETSFWTEFGNGANAGPMPGAYTAAVAASFDCRQWAGVTETHYSQIKRDFADAVAREQTQRAAVDLNDADVAAIVAAITPQPEPA